MDPTIGDRASADVLIRNGKIAAIADRLDASAVSDAQILDVRGMIVLPGLVDSHWHMWNSLARGLAPTQKACASSRR